MDEAICKEAKRLFRRKALLLRSNIENREEKSKIISNKLIETELFTEAEKIFAYMSYKSEADTEILIRSSLEKGKCIALPRVSGADMVFAGIMSYNDCVYGAYGIKEPKEKCEEVIPDEKTIIIVPGCAFTYDGARMGYGGGYYDRYLEKHKNITTVGYAFEEQIFEKIVIQEHDIRLDYIVTEKGLYKSEDYNTDSRKAKGNILEAGNRRI